MVSKLYPLYCWTNKADQLMKDKLHTKEKTVSSPLLKACAHIVYDLKKKKSSERQKPSDYALETGPEYMKTTRRQWEAKQEQLERV